MRAISRFSIFCSAILLISALTVPALGQCTQDVKTLPDGGTYNPLDHPAANACDLPHNDLRPSSISVAGLNAAAPFLDAIANGPLDDATLSHVTPNLGAVRPDVGKLLAKIVSCALPYGDHRVPVGNVPLHGEVGLCPEWGTQKLKPARRQQCQEVVSACVLARVNAVGAHVVLSLRGKNAKGAILQKPRLGVPVQTQYRKAGAMGPVDIPSFLPCTASNSTDCGFKPYYVGRCIPNNPINVTASDNNATIRVCSGIHGCEANGATPTAQAAQSYTSSLGDGLGAVSPPCRANGPERESGGRWGYYSIMVKAQQGSNDPEVTVTSTDGNYPANETDVFTYVEGAFYGNLFTSISRDKAAPEINHVLEGNEFACYSSGWTSGVAAMNERFCASPDVDCFINKPMACFKRPGNRCEKNAVSGGPYSDCLDTLPVAKAWDRPVTTYLNNPCDLSSDPKCKPDQVFRSRPTREPKASRVRHTSAKRD